MKTLLCPNCKTLFNLRKKGCCPACGIRIVRDGEIWFPEDEGYYYAKDEKFIPLDKIKFR
jgi:hypothetical protein